MAALERFRYSTGKLRVVWNKQSAVRILGRKLREKRAWDQADRKMQEPGARPGERLQRDEEVLTLRKPLTIPIVPLGVDEGSAW